MLAASAVSFACGAAPRQTRSPEGSPSAAPRPTLMAASGDASSGSGFDAELHQREAAYAQLAVSTATSSELGPFTQKLANWPLIGRVSSPYGPRWGGFHNGVDVAGPLYTPVRAAARGQVVVAGKPFLVYGDTASIVIIAHGSSFATLYAHLNDERPVVAKVGEMVEAGQVIAFNGSTGWSTGPHVHFTTVLNARAVDPMQFLP